MSISRFFGDDKSPGTYEALALQRLTVPQVRAETRLFQTKWFDYRPWHFMRATYYLAHCYRQACDRFLDQIQGQNRGKYGDPFGTLDVIASRELSALLTLRQVLDEHGMRYEWAMGQVVQRFSDRGWRLMPRPNQLYGEEVLFDLVDAWKEQCRASMQIPVDPRYRQTSGSQLQALYARWALDQAKARANPGLEWMPLSTLMRAGVVSAEQAQKVFPASQVAQATSVASINQH